MADYVKEPKGRFGPVAERYERLEKRLERLRRKIK